MIGNHSRISPNPLGGMETYPLHNENGEVFAFEIPQSYYFPTAGSIARFIQKCLGVQITRKRRLFEFGNEIHAEFLLEDTYFKVWEPFGDNSRLWIGPKCGTPKRVASIDKLLTFISSKWPGPVSKARAKVISWFIQAVRHLTRRST